MSPWPRICLASSRNRYQASAKLLHRHHKNCKEHVRLTIALQWWWILLQPQHLLHDGCWTLCASRELLMGTLSGVSKCCVTTRVETCSYGVSQRTGGERQSALAGYKFPCSHTSSPSADAECKRWSSSCQLPSSCSSRSAPRAQGHVNIPLSSLCPMEATGASGGIGNIAAMAMPMDLR